MSACLEGATHVPFERGSWSMANFAVQTLQYAGSTIGIAAAATATKNSPVLQSTGIRVVKLVDL